MGLYEKLNDVGRRRRSYMNVLEADFNLYDIEKLLEEMLRSEDKQIRAIGDLDLSYEDYKYLVFRVKGLQKYITRLEVFMEYRLSIVTALVFSVRYEQSISGTFKEIINMIESLQQHHVRYCVRCCADAFYELGLPTYGISVNSIEDFIEVLILHAGLYHEILNKLFVLLEQHYATPNYRLYDHDLMQQLQTELRTACCLESHEVEFYNVAVVTKKLFESSCKKHLSLKQMMEKHENVSSNLIEASYLWSVQFSQDANLLAKIY